MAQTYHTGAFKIITYMMPNYRDDPGFISEWRLDDISSNSGLDSQHSNNLTVSGGVTQVAGWKLASGIHFDGVNGCLFIDWVNGSGIEKLRAGFNTSTALNPVYSQFGFFANLLCEDFSREQVIFGRWNGTGNGRLFQVCLTSTSGIVIRWRQDGGSIISNVYGVDNLIPSGQWFNFGFLRSGRDSSKSVVAVMVNDAVVVTTTDDVSSWADSGSGMFHLGAVNAGNSPSGFFKGKMENVYWFNSKGFTLSEYNYWASGNLPTSSRPSINYYHPHLKGVWHLDSIDNGQYNPGQEKGLNTYERKFGHHLWASGTGSGNILLRPGAADGTKGSGFEFPSDAQFPNARFARHNLTIRANTILPKDSFTTSMWIRPYTADASVRALFGGNAQGSIFPFGYRLSSNQLVISITDGAGAITWNSTEKLIANNWAHVVFKTDMARARHTIFCSGVELQGTFQFKLSGLWLQESDSAQFLGLRITGEAATTAYSGILDEILFFRDALTSGEVTNFYTNQSGFITEGKPVSGLLGGYIAGDIPATGYLGGWIRGLGVPGGYLGGFIHGKNYASGRLGGWLAGVETPSLDATFYAYFDIVGRDKKEFDAISRIYKVSESLFDAMVTVYIRERVPDVTIIRPQTNQSGTIVPVTYHFEATASGFNNKSIYFTQWFFSDVPITSGSIVSSSGTFKCDHTFTKSGLFDVVFIVLDEAGLLNSDRIRINTASGFALPQITLNASPLSGIGPLTVGFSGIINNAPRPIVDKFIYFGDNTFSASTQNIMKTYICPGLYTPLFRVVDSSGFIATDSLVVGVNN